MRIEPSPTPTVLLPQEQGGTRAPAAGFGQALERVVLGALPAARTVTRGDTLVSVVREHAGQQGVRLSAGESLRMARQVARDSGIANPDRIFPGQRLTLDSVNTRLAAAGTAARPAVGAAQPPGSLSASATLAPSAFGAEQPAARALATQAALAPQAGVSFEAEAAIGTAQQRQAVAAYAAASSGAVVSRPTGSALTNSVAQPRSGPTAQTASSPAAQVLPSPVAQSGSGSMAPAVPSPVTQIVPSATAQTRPGSESPATRSFLAGPHPVLEQTLDRAVARGFIPAIERGDVYDKIMELAARHRFRPDDFARMTLMESDGLNPRASNERCHGIIQFCDGNDRGAATAGYAANPRAILGFSVYQQLHLVDRYFTEVGIRPQGSGPAGLDELYLAVLMPAARSQADPSAPLSIPGPQASYLHVGRDRSAPITRQSIVEGLQQNAQDRLAAYTQRMRPQALREEFLPTAFGATRLR